MSRVHFLQLISFAFVNAECIPGGHRRQLRNLVHHQGCHDFRFIATHTRTYTSTTNPLVHYQLPSPDTAKRHSLLARHHQRAPDHPDHGRYLDACGQDRRVDRSHPCRLRASGTKRCRQQSGHTAPVIFKSVFFCFCFCFL